MKIAITYDNGQVFQHFGKTEAFMVYEIEDGNLVNSEILPSNGAGHGALAGLLAEHAIDVLICGGIGAGIAYAMVRILGQRGQKGSSVVLFFSGFSCIVTLPYLLFNYHPMTGTQMLALLGAGLAAAGGQFGITAAYYHAPAKEISIYDYSQIIFSTILGYFLFGQVPDKYSVLGYVIILAMAAWMFFYNKRPEEKE